MNNFDRNIFINNIKQSDEFKNGNYVTAVLDELSNIFRKEDNIGDLYFNIQNIDERLFLLQSLTDYTYQVNNGGHSQYFDNGYASFLTIGLGYFSSKTEDISLFNDMHKLFKKYFPKNDITNKMNNIMDNFENNIINEDCHSCEGVGYFENNEEKQCSCCNGDGYINDEECDECNGSGYFIDEENEECFECHGRGYYDTFTCSNTDKIDKEFYSIDKEWYKLLENFANIIINKDISETTKYNWNNDKENSKPKVKLVGTDGNAFSLIGKCIEAMRKENINKEIIDKFKNEAMSGDYNNLLATCCKFCDVY